MTNEEFLEKYSTMAGSDKAIADKDKAFLYRSCTVAGAVDVIDEYCKADEPVVGPTGETGTTGSTESKEEKSEEPVVETQSAKSVKKSTKKVVVEEPVAE